MLNLFSTDYFIKKVYMEEFKYILCSRERVVDLLSFIDTFWRKDHILIKDRTLLDWQHKNIITGDYNFVLAISEKKNEILGILGFIPLYQFSQKLEVYKEAWLAVWKIRDNITYPGIGIGMISFLKKTLGLNNLLNLGLNDAAVGVFKTLKYNLGTQEHSVLINANRKKFSILGGYDISKIFSYPLILNNDYELSELTEKSLESVLDKNKKSVFITNPVKDTDYIINRYVKHPRYTYRVFSINKKNKICLAIIVIREIIIDNSSVLRIVDFQGDCVHFSYLNSVFKDILIKENHEYIDFLQFGIPKNILKKAGFISVKDNSDLIVPNHFEPFEKKNITVNFAYKSDLKNKTFFFFKADGDQDRPNHVS